MALKCGSARELMISVILDRVDKPKPTFVPCFNWWTWRERTAPCKPAGHIVVSQYIYIYIYIYIYKVGDRSREQPKGSLFNSYYTKVKRKALLISLGCSTFTHDAYFIILCVKQGDIEYHFLSLWYESTWNRTPVSRVTFEYYIHSTNGPVLYICKS